MTEETELTPLQQDELHALAGDRTAVIRVVSGLRLYRAAVEKALQAWADGEVDGYHTDELPDALVAAVEEIENE